MRALVPAQPIAAVGRATTSAARAYAPIALTGALAALLPLRYGDSRTMMGVIIGGALFAAYAVGFNVIFGSTGQLFLCVGALAGLGGYTSALLGDRTGLPVVLAMFLACLLAAAVGGMLSWIAVSRSLGVIFTGIVTLAFSLAFHNLLLGRRDLTRGETGLVVRAGADTFLGEQVAPYYAFVALVVACLVAHRALQRSRIGWAFRALRDDEVAAELAGVDVKRYRVLAGVIGSAMIGLAGALYAHSEGFISPSTFDFGQVDVRVVVMLAFGGIGSLLGPVIGAAAFTILDEWLVGSNEYRLIIYGAVIVVLFLGLPRGVAPTFRSLSPLRRGPGRRVFRSGDRHPHRGRGGAPRKRPSGAATFPGMLLERAKQIGERELATYSERTVGSQRATDRARKVLPLGVPSSFQAYDPHPIVVRHAAGPHMVDVDDNEYIDYDMGFGALFAGHMNPAVRAAVQSQLGDGSLYVTPCELNAEVAEMLRDRYGLPLWRFTNSGTEATMDALRLARGATGRSRIAKVEGGYHGHHDELMISLKPSLDVAGPADAPASIPESEGIAPDVIAGTVVVPYNDLAALEVVLSRGDIAGFILEPVMENIGIVLPDDGYLQGVRDLTTKYGTVLIFDEVKTGITAGYGGATGYFGVEPDVVTLAKSIGGGFPLGAFGGKQEIMDLITEGRVLHLGTYNGNPLVMAAARATLAEACAPAPTDEAIARNGRLVAACQAIIDDAGLPAHTVQFGAKGCVTWREERVRNYRDYRSGQIELAFAQWIHGINRGILLPPGLDEQWLISVMHDDESAMRYADVFAEFVAELTS